MVEIYRFGQKLNLVSEGIQSKSTLQMSRFERSLVSISSRKFMSDSTQPLAPFLQNMGFFLRNLVEGKLGDSRAEQVGVSYYC